MGQAKSYARKLTKDEPRSCCYAREIESCFGPFSRRVLVLGIVVFILEPLVFATRVDLNGSIIPSLHQWIDQSHPFAWFSYSVQPTRVGGSVQLHFHGLAGDFDVDNVVGEIFEPETISKWLYSACSRYMLYSCPCADVGFAQR